MKKQHMILASVGGVLLLAGGGWFMMGSSSVDADTAQDQVRTEPIVHRAIPSSDPVKRAKSARGSSSGRVAAAGQGQPDGEDAVGEDTGKKKKKKKSRRRRKKKDKGSQEDFEMPEIEEDAKRKLPALN